MLLTNHKGIVACNGRYYYINTDVPSDYGRMTDPSTEWHYCPTIDDPYLMNIANQIMLKSKTDKGRSKLALAFVQQTIRYTKDTALGEEEVFQLPFCALDRKKGDCEDFAFAIAGICQLCGIDTVTCRLQLSSGGHAVCAVKTEGWYHNFTLSSAQSSIKNNYIYLDGTIGVPIRGVTGTATLDDFYHVLSPTQEWKEQLKTI